MLSFLSYCCIFVCVVYVYISEINMFKPNLQTGLGLSYAYNHTLILVAACVCTQLCSSIVYCFV